MVIAVFEKSSVLKYVYIFGHLSSIVVKDVEYQEFASATSYS